MVLKEHSEDVGVNWTENGLYQSDLGGRTNGLSKEYTCTCWWEGREREIKAVLCLYSSCTSTC